MRKYKNSIKLFILTPIITGLVLSGFVFALPAFALTDSTTDEQTATNIVASDMLHFVMDVRWGNVIGEPTDVAQADFSGSVSVSANVARVSLIRKLKFEDHDSLTSKRNPVSWSSLIYNHWDGVRVLVSSPSSQNIIVTTAQGSVTKTAKEFFTMKEPFVQDVGNDKEIVIRTHPQPRHSFIAKILWGKPHRNDYDENEQKCDEKIAETTGADSVVSLRPIKCRLLVKENFSGSLTVTRGAKMQLIRTLRFERNDKILTRLPSEVTWESFIYGGVDGILVKFNLSRDISRNDTVTLSFPELDWSESISLTKLYHEKEIKRRIKPGYGVFVIVKKHPNGRLLRAKNSSDVYVIEDETKRRVPSADVFNENRYKWDEIMEVDESELDAIIDANELGFPDGTLVQGDGPEVYAIAEGKKRHISSADAFEKLGYDWGKIRRITARELGAYRLGDTLNDSLRHPEGSLIREEGKPMVFVVRGGKKLPIPSLEVFDTNKLNWNSVLVVKKLFVDRLTTGDNIQHGDGAVLTDSLGKVYKIDGGIKRWIRSAKDFVNSGEKWENILSVPTSDLDDFEEGEDVLADDF